MSDPTTDTLDKRLWLGSRIVQAEERLDTLGARIDALASRIGPAITVPEEGPSKEGMLELRFTTIMNSLRGRTFHTPATVASLMEAVRICGGLAKPQFPTQPITNRPSEQTR